MHDNHSHMNCKWPPRAIVRQCVTQRCLCTLHRVPWACSEAAEAIGARSTCGSVRLFTRRGESIAMESRGGCTSIAQLSTTERQQQVKVVGWSARARDGRRCG